MKKNEKKAEEKEQYIFITKNSVKVKIIFSSIALILSLFSELFFIINYKQNFEPIIIMSLINAILMYLLVSTVLNEKEIIERDHIRRYEDLYKSEKASFLLIRKNFEKFNEKLNQIDKKVGLPNTEFLEIQKRLTKIILEKNIENTKILQNEIHKCMEDISSKLDRFITDDKDYENVINNVKDSIVTNIELLLNESNKDFASQISLFNKDFNIKQEQIINQTDILLEHEKEIIQYINGLGQTLGELNLSIPLNNKVESSQEDVNNLNESFILENERIENNFDVDDKLLIVEPKEVEMKENEIHDLEEEIEKNTISEREKKSKEVNVDQNKILNADEIAAMFANVTIDDESEENPPNEIKEEEVKETPIIEVSGDPNKQLSADEIAALFASVGR